jgi:Ca-activated chloride channel family protein
MASSSLRTALAFASVAALAASLLAPGSAAAQRERSGGRPAAEVPAFRDLDPTTDRAASPGLSGALRATVGSRRVAFPSLKVDVDVVLDADLATVTVVQTFVNPFEHPMNATYLFPLHARAAVYEMVMEVGDERLRAEIQERAEALRTFEAAKAEGKSAALLQQHRPNMYTQDVANLMPGLPIKVTLKYVHAVDKQDDDYRLIVPLVVGPRYQPASSGRPAGESTASEPAKSGAWELEALPDYPAVSGLDIPDTVEKDRVSLRIRLNGGMPIDGLQSRTHEIVTAPRGKESVDVALKSGRTIDNRDFVLRYRLGGRDLAAGLLAAKDDRGGFFSLLLEPPPVPAESEISAREMVFVLDCSGSMYGVPMDASKAFMRAALKRLRPKDTFRVIRFSDGATEFSKTPLPATLVNVERGLAYVEELEGEGGTEMSAGILQALSVPAPDGTLRIVTFLTDGYIGNEQEILGLIKREIRDARLFAFGVGTSVNRFLLDKMGEMGRGFTRYMDPTEEVDAVALELAERLDAPVLTDIAIDWGGLDPDGLAPARIPDLFAGSTVRVQGRYERGGTRTVKITGLVAGRKATLPLTVHFPEAEAQGQGEAIPLLWARAQVEDKMDELSTPEEWRDPRLSDDQLREQVTKLGLEYGLLTRWTSFVAVSEKIYNDKPGSAVDTAVPLHKVKGVSSKAYGGKEAQAPTGFETEGTQGASLAPQGGNGGQLLAMVGSAFSGSSAPEPSAYTGLLVTAVAAWIAARRRRRPNGPGTEAET